MMLTYRGAHYDLTAVSTDRTLVKTVGNYRGVPVSFTFSKTVEPPQVIVRLAYRGIGYLAFH